MSAERKGLSFRSGFHFRNVRNVESLTWVFSAFLFVNCYLFILFIQLKQELFWETILVGYMFSFSVETLLRFWVTFLVFSGDFKPFFGGLFQ